MTSKITIKLQANGNLIDITQDGDSIYQGARAVSEYHLIADDWLATSVVYMTITRPDGQTGKFTMDRVGDEWVKTTEGWETDVPITEATPFTIAFEARVYNTVDLISYVLKRPSTNISLMMYPSAGWIPQNIVAQSETDLAEHLADTDIHITAEERSDWNAKSEFSGSYTDLTNKPTIPTLTSQLTNDSNFVVDADYVHTDNNFSDDNLSRLAGIEEGAQVNTVTSVASKTGAVTLVKADVGLGNVDNTSDLNKPISTATQSALDLKVDEEAGKGLSTNDLTAELKTAYDGAVTDKHTHSNKATLDNITASYTTAEASKLSGIEAGAEVNVIEVIKDSGGTPLTITDKTVTLPASSGGLELGETSETAYRGDRGKTAYDHSQLTTGNPHNLASSDLTDGTDLAKITDLDTKDVMPYIPVAHAGGNGWYVVGVYDYSTVSGDNMPLYRLVVKQGHGNGSSYLFWGEYIFGVNTSNAVTCKGILKVSDGTYGKIGYTIDTGTKILTLYMYQGQYSTVYYSDVVKINATSINFFTLSTPSTPAGVTPTEGINILYPASSGTMALASTTLSGYGITDAVNETTLGGVEGGTSASATTGGAIGNNAIETNGGGAIGQSADATYGGAVGNNASAGSGGAIGLNAITTSGGAVGSSTNAGSGGAIGLNATATFGFAGGQSASAGYGGAVGYGASATSGGAVGSGATATLGFAGGYNAVSSADGAVQLGTGTNSTTNTLQFRSYQVVDASGNIPSARISSSNAGTATTLQTSRTIGLSGVTATAQSFNGSANITIPVTAVTASLLTGDIAGARMSANLDALLTGANGKGEKVVTYSAGTTGYVQYASGLIINWISSNATGNNNTTYATWGKEFSNTNYGVGMTLINNGTNSENCMIAAKYTNKIACRHYNGYNVSLIAIGY